MCRFFAGFGPMFISLLLMVLPAAARSADTSVAVISAAPASKAEDQALLLPVVLAIRQELASRGRTLTDPAGVLESREPPSPELLLEAQKAFKLAVSLYDSLEFGKAKEGFRDALMQMREVMRKGGLAEDYVKALHYQAAASFYDGDADGAKRLFAEALAYAPEEKPDPSLFPPDVVAIFTEASAARGATGSMRLQCTVLAEAYVNGQPIGATPRTVEGLTQGHYLVSLRAPGYTQVQQWIFVEAGGMAELSAELAETPGLAAYLAALDRAQAELDHPAPGDGVRKLRALLGTGSVLLVARRGKAVLAAWAEGDFWVKRVRAALQPGGEADMAKALLAAAPHRPPSMAQVECRSDGDCKGPKTCASGHCVTRTASTPVYKTWWFWTIVGVAVAGATVGAVVGTLPDQWSAEVAAGVRP